MDLSEKRVLLLALIEHSARMHSKSNGDTVRRPDCGRDVINAENL